MQNRPFVQKKKESMVDLAYAGIRNLILTEEIRPGSLLSENQLAEYLHMSRTPVREAIRRLQAEGLLESIKGAGTFLKPISAKDVRDVYQIRILLELAACETAIVKITDAEIEEERKLLKDLLKRHAAGEEIDRMEFSRLDGNIHDMIINKSDNSYIKSLVKQIYFNVDRFRIISFKVSLNLVASTEQHLDLLDCIQERNLEKLKEHLKKHLEWSLKLLLDNMEL